MRVRTERVVQAGVALLVAVLGCVAVFAQTSVKNYFTPCSGVYCDNALTLAGTWKIGSTTVSATAATLNAAVAGVAAGYVVARGETALDGSNPTPATTGLSTIVSCAVSLKGTAAPGVGTSAITYATSSGTLNMYAWKVTASNDTTLIASTGTETIGWVCVGT